MRRAREVERARSTWTIERNRTERDRFDDVVYSWLTLTKATVRVLRSPSFLPSVDASSRARRPPRRGDQRALHHRRPHHAKHQRQRERPAGPAPVVRRERAEARRATVERKRERQRRQRRRRRASARPRPSPRGETQRREHRGDRQREREVKERQRAERGGRHAQGDDPQRAPRGLDPGTPGGVEESKIRSREMSDRRAAVRDDPRRRGDDPET